MQLLREGIQCVVTPMAARLDIKQMEKDILWRIAQNRNLGGSVFLYRRKEQSK